MKTLKTLLGLGVVIAGFYVLWMMIPPYFSNYQFQDAVDSEARLASYNHRKSEDEIRETIYKQAVELGLPIKQEQIKVQRDGGTVSISTEYQVHVPLPVYPLDLKFQVASKNKRL